MSDPCTLFDLTGRVACVTATRSGLCRREAADVLPPEGRDHTKAIPLTAPVFLSRAFVAAMWAKAWGWIVNFASLQTTRAFANGIAYCATKGRVGQWTRAMAQAWSSEGITANTLGPNCLPTELTQAIFDGGLGPLEWCATTARCPFVRRLSRSAHNLRCRTKYRAARLGQNNTPARPCTGPNNCFT